MITNSELSNIETRAKIATPPPWLIHPDPRYYVQIPFSADEQVKLDRDANAAFVANARDDVPKLIAEVRRLRSVISSIYEQAKYSIDHGLEPAHTSMWQIEADTYAELAAAEQAVEAELLPSQSNQGNADGPQPA